MEYKKYTLGIFKKHKQIVEENGIIHYYTSWNNTDMLARMNKNTNRMELFKIEKDAEDFSPLSDKEKDSNNIIKISEDGSRWEGDCYFGKPFGFGSFYDGQGNRIYTGFAFDGKKVGYGEEYFADSHSLDYCGYFLNNKRHGWGCSYDRNGNKLFEGEWRCGNNDFTTKVEIQEGCENDSTSIHNLLVELIIGKQNFNTWEVDLEIDNYYNLKTIHIGVFSFDKVKSLSIRDNPQLESVVIAHVCFNNVNRLRIESTLIFMILKG